MNPEYLVEMVNDISAFFVTETDHEEAPKSVASHISRFWDPRMRREIVAHYQSAKGVGLSDTSLRAVALLAQQAAAKSTAGTHTGS